MARRRRRALPEDILIEILLGLPVKSLLCNRNSLIQSHGFIKLHQNHSKFTKENASVFVMRSIRLALRPIGNSWFKTVFTPFVAETLTPIRDIDYYELPSVTYPKGRTYSSIKLYGPCNGITCINDYQGGHEYDFVLCNPATREFKTLPVPPFSYLENMETWDILTGFGFDEIGNDYKLVRVVRIRHCEDYTHLIYCYGPWKVEIYSLRDDTWTEVDVELPFSSSFVKYSDITYANNCHWIGYETANEEDEKDRCMYILVFDMGEEVFRKIHLTKEEDFFQGLDNGCGTMLIVYDGSLAMIIYDLNNAEYCFHIWVMREYGVLESWEKIIIGHLNGLYQPLASRNANELFLVSSVGDLVMCDLTTEAINAIGLSGAQYTFEVIIFQECLTSIKGCSAKQ